MNPTISVVGGPDLPRLDDLLARNTYCAKLARLLIAQRGRWIDGRALATVGGAYAWRSRLSNLYHAPWCLDVENRQRTERSADGKAYRVSEYRLK